jgi:uncharacterized protein YuzE
LLPEITQVSGKSLWITYDSEADVLDVNFARSAAADDSELGDDDVIVRYREGEVIGYTILHVSDRRPDST